MERVKNKGITSRDIDFAKWYTDIVTKAELVDYSSVKGCVILRPYGYAIWENIQKELDKKFKETNHHNVYMPMFIPESLLNVEKDHVEGFAPEVAWVTHGGSEELTERICVRPTSEVLFCDHYAKVVTSYRDLPKLYNQWCSVVRWEKTTRPFLRSREFLWQEGHTAHEDKEDAMNETLRMLNVYQEFLRDYLAIPAIMGEKTEKEKFAGAENTYTIESLMYNGIALQSGTSHYFGENFSRPFNITYTDRNNNQKFVHQTSWGLSTRVIGGIIMVHGDDNGLVMPPNIAPIKVAIIPIGNDEEVISKANEINEILKENNISSILDLTDKTPGYKFAEYEMKGVPVRIEIGPKDLEKGELTLVRRDNREKSSTKYDNIVDCVNELLNDIQANLYNKAVQRRDAMTYNAKSLEEIKEIATNHPGFIIAPWCGSRACEEKIKEETGVTSRCIPFEGSEVDEHDKCVVCNKKAEKKIYWGLQY